MRDAKEKKIKRAKSYNSVYDLFGLNPNDFQVQKSTDDSLIVGSSHSKESESKKKCKVEDCKSSYITCEKFQNLNKNYSFKSLFRSNSTLFYDLDNIKRRQSFNCLTDINLSNLRLETAHKHSLFQGQSNAIVQECATQIQPAFFPRDSIAINAKKAKKKFPDEIQLSSEIFLRDNNYEDATYSKRHSDSHGTNKQQKFWSYAKYRTEYTNPIPEEKKNKKKDRAKRTEDPCPCQLFSYACPCTGNKKSLTELANNSKSLTVAECTTSTAKVMVHDKKESKKKHHKEAVKECKVTSTSFKKTSMHEIGVRTDNPPEKEVLTPKVTEELQSDKVSAQNEKESVRSKAKSVKRLRLIICPKCNEKVEIVSSTEEEDFKTNGVHNRLKARPSTAAYTYRSSAIGPKKQINEGDLCTHDPPCEMVPMCHLIPEAYAKSNIPKVKSPKTSPRVIRITKACRHHPPCTVVPSCQRLNVLKNNCEYIPPCIHRPRCVNLPLCVPISKTFNVEDGPCNLLDQENNSECQHVPKCKYIPTCLDSFDNSMNHQVSIIPQVQNACEYVNNIHYMIPETNACLTSMPSPVPSPISCGCERSTKSCQYDCSDCKCDKLSKTPSDAAVIFIRDVGCQFCNVGYSPRESLMHSKTSSRSFEYTKMNMGNYYTNVHTLRYEDKFTSVRSRGELYTSGSVSSTEVDSQCPSHGQNAANRSRQTGFLPKNTKPYIATCAAYPYSKITYANSRTSNTECRDFKCHTAISDKSRKSFLKGKYKNIFCVKRRRKSKVSNDCTMSCGSRKKNNRIEFV